MLYNFHAILQYLIPLLLTGDNVWGLHNCGVLWLPAIVERIYVPSNISNTNGGEYLCDLWYPLTQRDLLKSRSMSASRELVQLPSSQRSIIALSNIADPLASNSFGDSVYNDNYNNNNDNLTDENMLTYPKPFSSERAACGYAFDLVDSDAKGIVELSKLVRCFCVQKEFQKIVDNNSALSIIFAEERMKSLSVSRPDTTSSVNTFNSNSSPKHVSRMDNEVIPSLLPVFIDTFSASSAAQDGENQEGEGEEAEDGMEKKEWISKVDFLEFCQAVVDIKKYSIAAANSDSTFGALQ